MLAIENNTVVSGTINGDDLILSTHGGADINAGNVRGPVGPQGPVGEVTQAMLDAAIADLADQLFQVGDIKVTFSSATPPGQWLEFNQSVASADTLYPELWAVAPSAWKSGTSLVLPDVGEVSLVGSTGGLTLADISGSNNNVTLSSSNLPQHRHTMAHDHQIGAHDHDLVYYGTAGMDGRHRHSMQHTHPAGTLTAAAAGEHAHAAAFTMVYYGGGNNLGLADGNVWGGVAGAPLNLTTSNPVSLGGDHTHTVTGSTGEIAVGADTGWTSHTHEYLVDNSDAYNSGGSSASHTGYEGSGTSFAVKNRMIVAHFWLKA